MKKLSHILIGALFCALVFALAVTSLYDMDRQSAAVAPPHTPEILISIAPAHTPLPTQPTIVPTPTATPEKAPRVLIYHTHTYEAYAQVAEDPYEEAYQAAWRTMDEQHNITFVGAQLAQALTTLGCEVVHDTTAYELPVLGTAYIRSCEALEKRIADGEEYDLIIDLHRDSYNAATWTPSTITLDGTTCARILFLIGNGEDGFSKKPNWKENEKTAQGIAQNLDAVSDGIVADVRVTDQRYNQHLSENCVLIEVGHCENKISEAAATMPYLAQAIAGYLEAR